jgi:outer membrane lipoprotein-sorting protein
MAGRAAVTLIVGHLILLLLGVACLGQESPAEEKDRAFLLEITVSSAAGVWSQEIVCDLPYKWRRETTIIKNSKRAHISDGETVWSYTSVDAKVSEISRLSVKDLLKSHQKTKVYELLFVEAMDGLVSPVNPVHSRWKDISHIKTVTKDLKLAGEDKVGETKTERFENKSGPKFVVWFGKDDGILRKQVLYKEDDMGNSKERITWTVVRIDKKPKTEKTTFALTPGAVPLGDGVKVQDRTKEVENELDDEPKKK